MKLQLIQGRLCYYLRSQCRLQQKLHPTIGLAWVSHPVTQKSGQVHFLRLELDIVSPNPIRTRFLYAHSVKAQFGTENPVSFYVTILRFVSPTFVVRLGKDNIKRADDAKSLIC